MTELGARTKVKFEMALGNRQLLSVFFIVVALLGVFFTVGYMVGKSGSTVLADSSQRTILPVIVDSVASPTAKVSAEPAQAHETPVAAAKAVSTSPKTAEKPAVQKAVTEISRQPEQGAFRTVAAVEPLKTASAPPEPAAQEPVRKQEPQSAARAESGAAAAGGRSYLQLAATSKPDADSMVDVLRQKGFSTVAIEIRERPGTWRVLVGPINDNGTALRADLQKMGFAGNDALRRTF